MFDDKTILITGGTGSFGNAVLKRFLKLPVKEIRIFSRDEKKQEDMRRKYNHPKLKFYIGDVRDMHSVMHACIGSDYVFHAAALKQVPSCEFFPMEAIKTNILGTENLLEAAIRSNVSKVVCLSSDKAVYPTNVMGMTKAVMEKILLAKSRNLSGRNIVITCTRYGNVMASRGSVIPLFVNQIKTGQPITITNPRMTRFMMTLDDAVDLVLYAFTHGENGDIFVQKAPASTIKDIAQGLRELLNCPKHPEVIIGTRHGEKMYESLLNREEVIASVDMGDYYKVPPDVRGLNYGIFIEQGMIYNSKISDYNSRNTVRLDLNATKKILMKLDTIRKMVETNSLDHEFEA